MANRWGNSGNSDRHHFLGAPKSFLSSPIPWPYFCYTTLNSTHLYTFISSLFQRLMHINLNRFTYWGMVLLETILLLCKSGGPRNVVKEAQNNDHSYRQTVDLHVLESILCMNNIAVHVLLLDNYKVSLGIKKVEIMFYLSIQFELIFHLWNISLFN